MQTLELNGDDASAVAIDLRPESRFAVAYKQQRLDWMAGVIMPVVCVVADPFVFKGLAGDGFLGIIKPFGYLLSFVSIMAMAAWLIWGRELGGWVSAFLSGLFWLGGIVAFLIGMVLLPFSILGIAFFGFGLLGLTPLVSGIIFMQNGTRAFKFSREELGTRTLISVFALSAVLSFAIPWVINAAMSK